MTTPGTEDDLAARIAEVYATEFGLADKPCLGIFWLDSKGDIHGNSKPLMEVEECFGFRNCEVYHVEEWGKIRADCGEFAGKWYNQIPRGRVMFEVERGKFLVYMPKEFLGSDKAKANVQRFFHLPSALVEYNFEEEHYLTWKR